MEYPQDLKKVATKAMEPFLTEGFLSGNGNEHAKLMFVGEAPGKTEVTSHLPFSGRAGQELDNLLNLINLKRTDVYITSTVRSRPYKYVAGRKISDMPNRKPTQKEITAHACLLDYEIRQVQPKIIATLGDVALKRLLGANFQLRNDHGKLLYHKIKQYDLTKQTYNWSDNKIYLMPLYHPAAIFYNPKLRDVIKQDWLNLHAALQRI